MAANGSSQGIGSLFTLIKRFVISADAASLRRAVETRRKLADQLRER